MFFMCSLRPCGSSVDWWVWAMRVRIDYSQTVQQSEIVGVTKTEVLWPSTQIMLGGNLGLMPSLHYGLISWQSAINGKSPTPGSPTIQSPVWTVPSRRPEGGQLDFQSADCQFVDSKNESARPAVGRLSLVWTLASRRPNALSPVWTLKPTVGNPATNHSASFFCHVRQRYLGLVDVLWWHPADDIKMSSTWFTDEAKMEMVEMWRAEPILYKYVDKRYKQWLS